MSKEHAYLCEGELDSLVVQRLVSQSMDSEVQLFFDSPLSTYEEKTKLKLYTKMHINCRFL